MIVILLVEKVPRDEGAAFVAPNATVLGDVVLETGYSGLVRSRAAGATTAP